MANIYSLQLLRNGQVFTSKEQAIAQLTSGATQDGVIKLARYTQAGTDPYSGDTNGDVKTIFAFRHEVGGKSGWTVYEDYKEVLDIIKAKIDSLAGSGSGSIYDQIMTELRKLDYSGVTTGDGVVVTNVTETDGVVSATSAEVGGLKLTNYALGSNSGAVAANDTINEALSKLQNQVNKANEDAEEAIKALDANITAADGSYIDKVEQVDGKISGTTKELPTVAPISEAGKPIVAVSETKGAVSAATGTINAEFVNVTGNTFTSSTVQGALEEIETEYKAADQALKEEIIGDASESANTLGKLEDIVNDLNADAATYTVKKVTTGLATNVKEQYVLVETKNGTSTDKEVAIPIYKDNTLKSVELVDQALQFTYIVDSGESVVSVDVSKFLAESEFASGVTVNSDGVVHGVVDPQSESFLTVGENGFKLAGVQAAIDAASGDVKSKLDELSGKTVTGVEMTGGTAAIANNTDGTKKITIDTDGSKIKATGYAKGTDASAIAATDSINAALAKLENQVDAAKAAATTKVAKDAAASHLTIASATSADGSVTYTIGESDIASKSDLDAEIAARKAVDGQNGQTYAANTSANYISGATSLNDADVKLDTALKAVEDAAGNVQDEVDAIETAVGLNADGTHKTSTGNYTSGADSIEGEIVALDGQVKTNTDNIAALSGKTVTGITMNGTGVTVTDNVAALTAVYTNTAANNENGMVITTGDDGGLTFQFGTLDAGTY